MHPDALGASLADRYRIERELGQGGMATVYLARDIKHDRSVALKVLRPELAALIGAERFLNEIRVTANLQHPHILPLHDSGEADSFLYYVMPLVEGETLRDKIDREKQLGIDQAVTLVRGVASALDYAHRQGVIHRDIKPENILLHDGQAIVADFGIAVAVSQAGGTRLTETGLSIGTPHYMSPEQAMGDRELDARSDVYSLGAVLYEALTGDPPYTGSTAQAIVAKVITEKPPSVSAVRDTVPPNVAAATTKALSKLPADRFATAAEFATALVTPSFALPASGAAAAAGSANQWRARFVAAALLAATLLAAVALLLLRPAGAPTLATYDVGLADTAAIDLQAWGALSVSADGRFVVYVARRGSNTELWYRSLVDSLARPIPGTAAGYRPSVSPNGGRVAFLADAKLHVAPIDGGTPTTLTDAVNATVRWTADDRIMLMNGDGTSLHWLDGTGQDRGAQATAYCLLPEPLGSGDQLLCGGGATKSAYLITPGTDSVSPVLPASAPEASAGGAGGGLRGSNFRVIDGKYLVYLSIAGDLRATTIDIPRRRVGRSVSLVSAIRRTAYSGEGLYDVSATGTLVYAPGEDAAVGHLVRYHPTIGLDTLNAPPAAYLRFALSGNGRWLAAAVEGVQEQELHVIDLSTGRSQTFLKDDYVGHPLWDPTSTTVIVDLGNRVTVRGSPTASTAPEVVFDAAFKPLRYASDDVVFGQIEHEFIGPVGMLDLSASPPRLDTLVAEGGFPALSPDGRWIAYNSVGYDRLFVSPVRDTRTRYQVAVEHEDPQWLSPTELLFSKYGDVHTFKIVTIDPNAGPVLGVVRDWYTDPLFTPTPGRTYTVTPDGGVVYLQGPSRRTGTFLRVVPNWVERMKHAVDEANR